MTKLEELLNCLENWKFESAYEVAKEVTLTWQQMCVVRRLASSYGDSGVFGGSVGNLVSSVVELLCGMLKEAHDD